MTTIHDDRPHPIPPFAQLRWKENYFFILMDQRNSVFGVAHLNNEPLFNRSRFTLNLSAQGRPFRYANEVALPERFSGAAELSDGRLTLRFLRPHRHFQLAFAGEDLQATIEFEARLPTFDFVACKSAAPELPSFQEVMTLGLNLPYNHQQQSLTTSGRIDFSAAGSDSAWSLTIEGLGYRDHSWCMRSDNISRRHVWSGLNFPGRTFGIKAIETTHRPGLWAKEGYVSDADGARVLRRIDITHDGDRNGWPQTTQFAVEDMTGRVFTINADIAGRFADVPLHSEKPGSAGPGYQILETFCPLTLVETGERGIGLVEIGRHPSVTDPH